MSHDTIRTDTHEYSVRTTLDGRDVKAVADWHRDVYQREWGFDATFGDYVFESLSAYEASDRSGARTWLVEHHDRLVGFIGIVQVAPGEAQLRWYLVCEDARHGGVGRWLMTTALDFCRDRGHRSVFLWTVHVLAPAARVYEKCAFVLEESRPSRTLWGLELVEQKYRRVIEVGEEIR